MFDVRFARSHFPALTDDWALFDNAGGSVPLAGVIERVHDYMSRWQVQLGATYDPRPRPPHGSPRAGTPWRGSSTPRRRRSSSAHPAR
jgi:hypothetical protein